MANIVGHGTITSDRSLDQKSDGRDTYLLAGSIGEINSQLPVRFEVTHACANTHCSVSMHSYVRSENRTLCSNDISDSE